MSNPNEGRPPYKAVQVANKFIELGRQDDIADLSNMKLQKLVFFCPFDNDERPWGSIN